MSRLDGMTVLTIDFETFYSSKEGFTLSKMTTEEYIRDARFQVIGVGVGTGGLYEWMEHAQFADLAARLDWSRVIVRCHHAHFDGAILSHIYGVHPAAFECTLSMGRALHGVEVGNSLAKLSEHYGAGEKGHEVVQADGKRREDFTRAEWLQYGVYCCNDCALCDRIHDAMMADGFPAQEKPIIDLTVKMFTNPHMVLDAERAKEFEKSEQAHKQRLMNLAGITDPKDMMSNEKMAGLLLAAGVEPPTKWSVKKGKYDWAFAKNDPEFEALQEHPSIGDMVKARLGVKSTINETRVRRLLGMASRGKLMVYIKSSGAHTHRWVGAEKLNWQNLERVNPDDPESGILRKCLLAPPGWKFVVADSGQIEARVLAWLVGQQDLVDAFAAMDRIPEEKRTEDVYTRASSVVYGRPVGVKEKRLRSVGKVMVLALGYGMGWKKFAAGMLAGPMGAKPIKFSEADAATMGVDIGRFLKSEKVTQLGEVPSVLPQDQLAVHAAVCDHLVNVYRNAHPAVTRFWYEVCPLLLQCMLEGRKEQCGPLRTEKNALVLPSGLKLRYPELKVEDENGRPSFSYYKAKSAKSGFRARMYGGLLTENADQALSTVIIKDQMGALYEAGYIGPGSNWHVVTTTHDEVVMMVPEDEAEHAATVLIEVMKIAPDWAPGLPLNASGGVADTYGDAK